VGGVYYRPSSQGEPTDKAFFQLQEASHSQALRGTSTTPRSAGKAAWRAVGNPGDCWRSMRCRSQQGPQCGAINKGGRAGTCWPQALGRNEIVSSLPGGGSIALVKINLRNVSVEISLKNVCLRQRLC